MSTTKEQLLAIANEVKVYTERRTKKEVGAFIEAYRRWDEENKGVTPKEFWAIVERTGLKVPAKVKAELRARVR